MALSVRSVDRIVAVAGLIAAGFLIAAPQHGLMPARHGLTRVTPDGVSLAAPRVSDIPSVGTVWPAARTFTMPAGTPDGRSYTPLAVLDTGRSVGTLTSPDGTEASLVLMSGGTIRQLQAAMSTADGSFDAFAGDGTYVYWMQNATGHESLWRAALAGGTPPEKLTGDTGKTLFSGSVHDLQVDRANLTWVSSGGAGTEVRAVPLAGGRVTTHSLPGDWAELDPPWLVTGPGSEGTQVQIYDPATGARTKVKVARFDTTACSRTWCVTQAVTNDGLGAVQLARPNGSDQRTLGNGDVDLVSTDVALRDRFEVLSRQNDPGGADGPQSTERLWLYDIAARRPVLVSDVATSAYAAGDFVWWSTDGADAPIWNALDLRSLTGGPR